MLPKSLEAAVPDESAPISFIRELSGEGAQQSEFTVPPLRSILSREVPARGSGC